MKKTNEIKEALKKGDYKDLLTDIYVDESRIEYQTERYIKAIEKLKSFMVMEMQQYTVHREEARLVEIIQTISTVRF